MTNGDRGAAARLCRAGERALRHRGRKAVAIVQSGLSVRHGLWLITPLSWLLFALNLMGYFFLSGWTPTLLDRGQAAAGDGGARRGAAAGRRHGRRADAVLVAAAASLPRHLVVCSCWRSRWSARSALPASPRKPPC